jgi:PIN domain
MHAETNDLPPPVNHVFVDYENVHGVDAAVIETKTVHLILLLGPQRTKFDATLVEKLLHHAVNVEMIRLKSSGRNALDFALAYYLGRAVLADPCGHFHIVSKDTGYDPLIEHLRTKHIAARRHDDFTTLTFAAETKLRTPTSSAVAQKPKTRSKPKIQLSILDQPESRVLEHLRKATSTRPRNEKKLISWLIAYLGHKITGTEALNLVKSLSQAGHLIIGEKGVITYHLERK